MKLYLQHPPVFSPAEHGLHRGDECVGWQGLWEGRAGIRWAGCREWEEDEERHCREQEGAEWAGKGQFRCPPSCRAEARKGGHNKNMVRWQLWSAFETSLMQDTTFPAALQGWELLCYHKGHAKGCTLLLGANIGIVTLFLGTKQGKLAKLLQYHSALVLDFDPTDKGSACH